MDKMLACPSCHREFSPGVSWHGSNWCRVAVLIPVMEKQDGLSAYEIASLSGMNYRIAAKALEKLRELDLFEYRAESRESGGIRYRYYRRPDHEQRKSRFLMLLKGVEARSLSQSGQDVLGELI